MSFVSMKFKFVGKTKNWGRSQLIEPQSHQPAVHFVSGNIIC